MLFDPNHDQPSLHSLIVRLQAEDPETTYQVDEPETCLVARLYGKVYISLTKFGDAFAHAIYAPPYTYGAALARAKRELEKS